ncbi:serine--tRNA ligase [Synechococcus phage MinM1]|nr:serine--tRNA ligase [Synechococcus phage MinM1]
MDQPVGFYAALMGGSAALGSLLTWILQTRKDGREATSAAITALRATLEEQRAEIDRLAERMTAATDGEERCLERVRALRQDIHALCGALQRAGVPVPRLPSASAPAGAD